MAITLDTITLPDDLLWIDEFAFSAIVQQGDYALDGALILQESTVLAGRPITLVGAQDKAWATRATVLALQALADAATDTNHTLTLNDARTFTVRFRRSSPSNLLSSSGSSTSNSGLPFTATPVIPFSDPASDDAYVLTVNLFVVPT